MQLHIARKWRKKSPFPRIKNATKHFQKGFLYLSQWLTRNHNSVSRIENLGNVKKGHFSVIVQSNGEPKKFMVSLRYLAHPSFVKLLDAAEQEFGFNQMGVLVIPCDASELQRIIS